MGDKRSNAVRFPLLGVIGLVTSNAGLIGAPAHSNGVMCCPATLEQAEPREG
jgi:hypothetical protein